MTEQERRTAEALARLHPDLAGFFNNCHEMIERGLRPGDKYLLAVAARELTNGVVSALDAVLDPSIWGDVPAEVERHRIGLARILGLPTGDPMVTQWFAAHDAFNGACHWGNPISPATLVEHFRTLSAILVTRLGPFFDTQDELERLAELEAPTVDDGARLRSLLLLPVQREHFFQRAKSPRWLEHLEALGAFDRLPRTPPPERWDELARWASWPEGLYLEHIAGTRPDDVRRLLLAAPAQSDNPLVWARIINAALALPAEPAAAVAAALTRKLNDFSSIGVGMDALQLATKLLTARMPEGLNLLTGLLNLRRAEGLEQSAASPESVWRREREPFFDRLPGFMLDELVETVLPTAIEADPVTLARRLLAITKKAIDMAVPDGETPAASKAWCRDIDGDDHEHGVRAALLRSLARTLVQAVRIGAVEAVDEVLNRLAEEEHDAFARVLWYVLAEVGDSLPTWLATALSDERLLHEWWGSREAALLLRRQLANVPPGQQLVVRYAFERGPSPGDLAAMLRWRGIEQPSEADVAREIAAWQRTRLRWFRGNIPPVLQPLAERLGVLGEVPTIEEQELAEDHMSTPRVGYVAPRRPATVEQWPAWSRAERLEYLKQWRPGERTHFTDERAGLYELVRQSAESEPTDTTEMLVDSFSVIPPGAIVAMMQGLRQAIVGGRAVSLAWIESVVQQLTEAPGAESGDGPWQFKLATALQEVLQLIDEAGQRDRIVPDDMPRVVAAVEMIPASPVVGEQTDVVLEQRGFRRAELNGLNALGGELVQAVVALGLTLYRTRPEADRDVAFSEHVSGQLFRTRLVPVLDGLLDAAGICGLAARHQIGQYLPQLRLLDADWVRTRVVPHFATGISDPDDDPIWPAYLVGTPLYDDVYREWAVWYAQAARTMPVKTPGSSERADPFAGLVLHLTIAYLRGLAELSEEGSGLAAALRRASPTMLSHLYWQLYRDFADTSDPLPESILTRFQALGNWRIGELEAMAPEEGREEEANGLAWLVASEHVSPARALQLGLRVIPLMGGKTATLGMIWPRVEAFTQEDPAATLRLVAAMLQAHFRTPMPRISMDEARAACATLRPLVSQPDWEQFVEVVADLGRRGWRELRAILP